MAARLIREGLDAANMTAAATSGGGASGGLEAARRKSFFGTALASLALVSTIFGTAYVVLTETGRDWLSTQLKDHTNLPGANFIYENFVRWFTDPSRDKLLPDFPPEIASSEHQPRTLILDLVSRFYFGRYLYTYARAHAAPNNTGGHPRPSRVESRVRMENG